MLYFRILCWKKQRLKCSFFRFIQDPVLKAQRFSHYIKPWSIIACVQTTLLLSEGGVCQRHRLSNNYPSLDLSFSIKKGVFPNTVEGKCPLNRAGLSWGLVIINQQSKIYQTAVIQLLESCIQKLSLEGFVQEATHCPPLFSLSSVHIQKQGHFYHFYYGNVFNWVFKSAKRFSDGLTKSMKRRKGDISFQRQRKKNIHSLVFATFRKSIAKNSLCFFLFRAIWIKGLLIRLPSLFLQSFGAINLCPLEWFSDEHIISFIYVCFTFGW